MAAASASGRGDAATAAASGSGNAARSGALPAVSPSIWPAAAASSSPQLPLPSHLPSAQQDPARPCTRRWRSPPSTRIQDCPISSISDRRYHGTNANASACSTARLTFVPELTTAGDPHSF
ncbi:hypothetical protein ACP70R_023253 [Stipagrostis hirtigluma subsp. patula]